MIYAISYYNFNYNTNNKQEAINITINIIILELKKVKAYNYHSNKSELLIPIYQSIKNKEYEKAIKLYFELKSKYNNVWHLSYYVINNDLINEIDNETSLLFDQKIKEAIFK